LLQIRGRCASTYLCCSLSSLSVFLSRSLSCVCNVVTIPDDVTPLDVLTARVNVLMGGERALTYRGLFVQQGPGTEPVELSQTELRPADMVMW
jgi:hypothetical protein